jgi:hypothetical protein
MNDGQSERTKPLDPFEPFRGMRDAYLDAAAKVMVDAVNSEGYAQATGIMLDAYLTASAPFREALERSMVHALEQLSLPSRQEVAALAARFTNLEMRLDDMDAKLDAIVASQQKAAPMAAKPAEAPRPWPAAAATATGAEPPAPKAKPPGERGARNSKR